MVLVTGGTGLVGSHLLLRLCENGEAVRALYRDEGSIEKTRRIFNIYNNATLFERIEWVNGNINDVPSLANAFLNVSEVYHCAALISFDPNDEDLLRKVNIEGTANIVNLCLDSKVRKLAYVSSVAALGDLKPNESVVTENSEWNPEKPHSDYAISKYGAEMEIWRGQQEGLDSIVLNPGIILGPGFWEKGSGQIFSRVKNGLKYYTNGVTGFVDVEDVIATLIKLMKSDVVNERFIAVSENISFKEVVSLIAESLKMNPPSIYASPQFTSLALTIDWLKSSLLGSKRKLSKDSIRALHSKTIYSSEKLEKYLNYNFNEIAPVIAEIVKLQRH